MNINSRRVIVWALCICMAVLPFYSIAQNIVKPPLQSNDTALFRPETGVEQLSVQLYAVTASSADTFVNIDGALAQYNSLYNAVVDWQDAKKFGNINEGLGLLRDGVILSIERRPLITDYDTLFLDLTGTSVKTYQLRLTGSNWPEPSGLLCKLYDNYLNVYTNVNLTTTTTITFSITGNNGSASATRFMVLFAQPPQGGAVPVTFKGIEAALQNSATVIDWQVANEMDVLQYEIESSIDGTQFTQAGAVTATGASNYQWTDQPLTPAAFYRVVSIDNNGNKTYSTIVAINKTTINQSIEFAGNVDNGIALKFTGMPQGTYTAVLLGINGQRLAHKTISFGGGTSNVTVKFDGTQANGVRIVEIINPDKTKSFFKVNM